MMKKKAATGLIFILMMAMAATGCGGSGTPYDYDLSEYIKVGDYVGIEYDAIEIEVTDEEIESEIQDVLEQYSDQTELTEGTIENGDYVKMSYSLEMDGKKVDSVAAENYTMQVGEGVMLEDIDKALVGKSVGDTFEVTTTFPEDYDINPEMAGKEGTFTITVTSKYLIDFPEYNDEFVAKYLDYDTVEEYETALRESLYETKLENATYTAGEEIFNQIVEKAEVLKYPKKEMEDTTETLKANFESICEEYGMTVESALEDILDMTEDEFDEEMESSAEKNVKDELVLYYIARENDLEMTEEEYQDYLKETLLQNDMTEEEFEEQYSMDLETYAEQNRIGISLLYERVFQFLVENGAPV